MPYRIQETPKPQKLNLDVLDGPDTPAAERTYVVVRHADGNDQLMLEEVTTATAYTYDMEGFGRVRESKPAAEYLANARKAFCVVTECNILDADGQPLLKPRMSWSDYMNAWAKLAPVARDAIVQKVIEVNPHWGNW